MAAEKEIPLFFSSLFIKDDNKKEGSIVLIPLLMKYHKIRFLVIGRPIPFTLTQKCAEPLKV
jgi:hypothetical protein